MSDATQPRLPSTVSRIEDEGILVGRVALSKHAFEYVIIPRRDDIDVFVTTPPNEILKEMLVVNTLAVNKILRHPYLVRFKWKIYYTFANQVIYRAFITSHRKIEINLDDPLKPFKEIDPDAEYEVFERPPAIDQNFLLSLSRSTGASITAMPKRFYSIGVATKVIDNNNETTVYMNLAECFQWLQENVSKIRGEILLPSFKYAILIVEPITKDELRDEILSRINTSASEFHNLLTSPGVIALGGETVAE